MFKTFPEFSKLTLNDREEYEEFIKDCPPISDLAFASLMTVWSALDQARVAVLNGNLVISFWMPGDDNRSGLSLIGTNKVDESLCAIFDHLTSSGQEARIVNVPQFVVDHIRYPEIFGFDFKSGDEDYIISLKRHASLEQMPFYKRARIKKFVRNGGNLEMKSLDLRLLSNRRMLLESAEQWPRKGLNNIAAFEEEAMRQCVMHAPALGLENVCLFEDGKLIIFNLYHIFPDSRYMLVAHARLDYSIPFIFDYMTYDFSRWWLERGLEFANIHSDMGLPRLRVFKVTLRPVELLRKYTIKPVEQSHSRNLFSNVPN